MNVVFHSWKLFPSWWKCQSIFIIDENENVCPLVGRIFRFFFCCSKNIFVFRNMSNFLIFWLRVPKIRIFCMAWSISHELSIQVKFIKKHTFRVKKQKSWNFWYLFLKVCLEVYYWLMMKNCNAKLFFSIKIFMIWNMIDYYVLDENLRWLSFPVHFLNKKMCWWKQKEMLFF